MCEVVGYQDAQLDDDAGVGETHGEASCIAQEVILVQMVAHQEQHGHYRMSYNVKLGNGLTAPKAIIDPSDNLATDHPAYTCHHHYQR